MVCSAVFWGLLTMRRSLPLAMVLLSCCHGVNLRGAEPSIPVIDCHMHTGNWRYHWSTDDLAPILRREGIRFGLVSALESPPKRQADSNREVLKEVAKHPDLFGALAWANPLEEGWREDLTATLDSGHCYGIKIHPARYKYDLGKFPQILRGVFEVARQYKLPVLTHTDEKFSPPKNFVTLIEEFPDVPLVLYHSYPMIDSIAIALAHANVYVENSWVADNPDFVLVAVKALGSRRVLYGTDAPVSFGWKPGEPLPESQRFFARRIKYIMDLPLPARAKEDILFRNAQRLFRLRLPK